jgi:cytoskeleton protein RodZ
MGRLGERLRLARESRGISLSRAAAETRILQRYLVALEDSDFINLPGDVYTRGFIRNYANYLELPAEELLEMYRIERGRADPVTVISAPAPPRLRLMFVPSVLGVFFVVLTMIGLSYLILTLTSRIGENALLESEATAFPTPVAEPSALPTPLPTTLPTTAPRTTPAAGGAVDLIPATPTPPPAPEAPIVIEVRVDPGNNRGSWLRIATDGKVVYQQTALAGEVLRFTAQRDIFVRAGNAFIVTVVINGQEQRLSTTPGEVVNFTWPPN